MNPYKVISDFEKALAYYTGAKYAVCVNSCTNALLLACAWFRHSGSHYPAMIDIPKRTYVSVPMSIIHAGYRVRFIDAVWQGGYQLFPLPVYDFAKRFTSDMYEDGTFQCVSFHSSKILGIEQGGAILHDNDEADIWLQKARFDGRTPGRATYEDHFDMIGYHCPMNPSTAAQGLLKLYSLPKHNQDLPFDEYPDLSKFEVFK